uniref:Uncharacterized protein n=1 Tax=viral metagenome TaxID=1070528 RepID=A0A6C0JNA0_9ZZZZ
MASPRTEGPIPTTVIFKHDSNDAIVSINGKSTPIIIKLTGTPIKEDGELKSNNEINAITIAGEAKVEGAGEAKVEGAGEAGGGGGDGKRDGGSSRKFRKKVGGRRGKGKSKKHSSSRKSKY